MKTVVTILAIVFVSLHNDCAAQGHKPDEKTLGSVKADEIIDHLNYLLTVNGVKDSVQLTKYGDLYFTKSVQVMNPCRLVYSYMPGKGKKQSQKLVFAYHKNDDTAFSTVRLRDIQVVTNYYESGSHDNDSKHDIEKAINDRSKSYVEFQSDEAADEFVELLDALAGLCK